MKRYFGHIIMMVALLSSSGVRAQVTLGADTIVLGDQTEVLFPSGSELLPPQEVLVLGVAMDSASGMMRATVTSFEPGEHWLKAGLDSLPLVVLDVEVDTTTAEIRDIAPIERVPYTFWEIFRWVLLALAIATVGVAVWWFATHRKQVKQALGLTPPVDTRNPYERASESLESLREKRLWQAGKVKEYHTELTDIVRRFIEESTGIRATEMTSDETVAEMESGGWIRSEVGGRRSELRSEVGGLRSEIRSEVGGRSSDFRPRTSDLLRSVFATADLVKFAKSEPLPHEHEASLKAAIDFVGALWEEVKPTEEEVSNG